MIKDFKALKITIASPEDILAWSHGEVKKAETINYRTQRPEIDGLMCERIFGPTKNYECYCGKYKKVRFKGIVCDKCGVEVGPKSIRRERMGHIKLVAPVTHVWFAHGVPNKLSLLLNIPQKKLTAVIYFSRYMVIGVDGDKKKQALQMIEEKKTLDIQQIKDELDGQVKIVNEIKGKEESELDPKIENESRELQVEQVNFKARQKIARLKETYLKREHEVSQTNQDLINIINKVVIGEILSEEEYIRLEENDVDFFQLQMGAEAIKTLLKNIDLEKEAENLRRDADSDSLQKKLKAMQRLRVVEGFRINKIKPEWLVMDAIPVISPELRPIIQLAGGKFASADLNDLYRRVINRNNRLKKLIELGAPEIILRNEKRMLQESVDALIDNNHRPSPPVTNNRRLPYKSLSDQLRGKQGRFRQNLLGKRVDYSGRAVIVGGPELKLDECGLPKSMALELFRPFVIGEILARGLAPNIPSAKYFFEKQSSEVWDILEEIISRRPVLLNRAPTLHKQGIQAFFPILCDGSAIRLHPMVCSGFNADFDGDQMAVHVPLSEEAVNEARDLMMAKNNVLYLTDGSPLIKTTNDSIFGIYFLTGTDLDSKVIDRIFENENAAISAYDSGKIGLRNLLKVKIRKTNQLIETTVGRILLNELLPDDFEFINNQLGKDSLNELVARHIDKKGIDNSIDFLDRLKYLGFKYATKSGFSFSMHDCKMIDNRKEVIDQFSKEEEKLEGTFQQGLITRREKTRLSETIWYKATDTLAQLSWDNLPKDNPLRQMVDSKATKASIDQVKQILGMRGLVLDPNGKPVELPIKSNFKVGLSEFEYFVGARATRKIFADIALKTSESGYLTRRLVDVAQDVITREEDCGYQGEGMEISKKDERRLAYVKRIEGRWTAQPVKDSKGKIIVNADSEITPELAAFIDKSDIESVFVRSPLICRARFGICGKCYGYDIGTRQLVKLGTAVGVIAAQAFGEPATQLNLNVKHKGGVAGVTEITQGLPRVEELFEARIPKGEAKISDIDGVVSITKDGKSDNFSVKVIGTQKLVEEYVVTHDDKINFEGKLKVKEGDILFTSKSKGEIIAPFKGLATLEGKKLRLEAQKILEVEYFIPSDTEILVQEGQEINAGTHITRGNISPNVLLATVGMQKAQKYIIDNIQDTFGSQGVALNDKHAEVIVSQMGRYVRILNPGDSNFLPGDNKDKFEVEIMNEKLVREGKKTVKFRSQLMGITAASIRTESFLSAASFQEQVRVLSDAAIVGKIDYLRGLKENVIIGRLIPTGERAKDVTISI